MKKMKLILVLLIVTFGFAFCQPDKTFTKPVVFEAPIHVVKITFPDGTEMESAIGGAQTINWETLAGKPSIFPTSWDSIQDKPETFPPDMSAIETIELTLALEQLGFYFNKTTAEIDAIVPPNGQGIAIDKTLGVYKVYSEGRWKIIPTTN